MGSERNLSSGDDDFVPSGGSSGGDFGVAPEELELRDEGEGIVDGTYNGREMVTGVLDPVYFGFDSSSIRREEREKVREAAEYLEENSSAGLLIEGHCDWHGTSEYNLALGDRRAKSVRDYLETLGVSGDRIETLSKGDLEATPGLSKEQAAEERRAKLIVLR